MTNEEKVMEIAEYLNQPNGSNSLLECHQAAMAMAKWKDEQILLDDDDKLATEVKVDGVTITPPQGYLIGRVTHITEEQDLVLQSVKTL